MNARPYSAQFDPTRGQVRMVYGRGMGDVVPGTCGPNPCGIFDAIYASDACVAYKCCTDPTGFDCQALTGGLLSASKQAIGSAAASAVNPAPLFQGLTNFTGSWGSTLLWIAGLGLGVAWVLKKL